MEDLDEYKANYLKILASLNRVQANSCTLKRLAFDLDVSLRKFSDFRNGKLYDYFLLCDYAEILGLKIGTFLMNE